MLDTDRHGKLAPDTWGWHPTTVTPRASSENKISP
jgi:hypothetical protein